MRNNKNNITSSVRNITLNLRNITSHFTGKAKIITLVLVIIMLSFINTTFTSALSYQSNVGVGFTFNPTLSVSISPSNLVIDSLTPSITADSNAITVSVATNAAYGYTLSAMVNNNNGNSGNGSNNNNSNSNSNLTHTNGTSVFSSIATDASLSSLTNDNTWGYSYRLSNNSNNNAWSNYSGLSNETSKTLVDSNDQTATPIDFKIAAKASDTQPSGAYTGTINFTAVSKHIPVSLAEAYASEGKTMFNGYYTMQDMNSTICNKAEVTDAQLQVIDIRDKKVYWIAKLKDGHCWMTQNLDLDLSTSTILTSNDTDLNDNSLSGAYSQATGYNYDSATNIISWRPANNTNTWDNSNIYPYSKDRGKYYPEGTPENETINDYHRLNGNYYNWTAAIASNDSSTIVDDTYEDIDASPQNSVCPKGWRLPTISSVAEYSEFRRLVSLYGNTPAKIIAKPLEFVRSGYVNNGNINSSGSNGYYWSSTVDSSTRARALGFFSGGIGPSNSGDRNYGFSVRCLAH